MKGNNLDLNNYHLQQMFQNQNNLQMERHPLHESCLDSLLSFSYQNYK